MDRALLKQNAKASIKQAGSGVYLVVLVYYIVVQVLGILGLKVMYPGLHPFDLLTGSVNFEALVRSVSTGGRLLNTAISWISNVIALGLLIFCLNISRGLKAEMGNLFDGFGRFFKYIWLMIVKSFFLVLWACLGVIPGVILFVLIVPSGINGFAYYGLLIFWELILMIPVYIAAYRYSMAEYIFIDNPYNGALDCINQSKKMMRGNKGKLFVLDLSFIGWNLLAIIPFASVFIIPYVQVTFANFYNELSGAGKTHDYYVDDSSTWQ